MKGSTLAVAGCSFLLLSTNSVTPVARPTPPSAKPTIESVLAVSPLLPSDSRLSNSGPGSSHGPESAQLSLVPSLACRYLLWALRQKRVPTPSPPTPTPSATWAPVRRPLPLLGVLVSAASFGWGGGATGAATT